jgi:hypothetical protein
VDEADYELLVKYPWHAQMTGYAACSSLGQSMHRFLLQPPRDMQIDHINGNKLDNRRENLRVVTHAQNQMNRPARANSYKGVKRSENGRRWVVGVMSDYKAFHVGTFDTQEEAAWMYDQWALTLHDEFAATNFLYE